MEFLILKKKFNLAEIGFFLLESVSLSGSTSLLTLQDYTKYCS